MSMKLSFLVSVSLVLVACGQAEPSSEEAGGSTSDELRNLDTTEVVGEITAEGSFQEVAAPELATGSRPGYRALSFRAAKGQRFVADVVVGNATDPMAYILNGSFATLARNDDADADTKDSRITWTASKAGTYYVAFRNKEGWATRYYVRLQSDTATPSTSWRDGWAEGSTSVELSTTTGGNNYGYPNSCDPSLLRRPQDESRASLTCKVDAGAARITCGLPGLTLGSKTTDIAEDGSFTIDLHESWGRNTDYALGHGTVKPGGLVTMTDLTTFHCGPNSSDQLYSVGYWFDGATGVAR